MSDPSASIQDRVRKAAPATLVGAVLLLFFGFIYLNRPTGVDWFSRAALVLYFTLRIGGVLFLVIAFLLYTGWPGALGLDAAIALPVGAILIGCGVVMILDNGGVVNGVILIVCGASFLSSGWRNGKEFAQIRSGASIGPIQVIGGDESIKA
jgi:hypothetical protein